jgi:hypothetical protein
MLKALRNPVVPQLHLCHSSIYRAGYSEGWRKTRSTTNSVKPRRLVAVADAILGMVHTDVLLLLLLLLRRP